MTVSNESLTIADDLLCWVKPCLSFGDYNTLRQQVAEALEASWQDGYAEGIQATLMKFDQKMWEGQP